MLPDEHLSEWYKHASLRRLWTFPLFQLFISTKPSHPNTDHAPSMCVQTHIFICRERTYANKYARDILQKRELI